MQKSSKVVLRQGSLTTTTTTHPKNPTHPTELKDFFTILSSFLSFQPNITSHQTRYNKHKYSITSQIQQQQNCVVIIQITLESNLLSPSKQPRKENPLFICEKPFLASLFSLYSLTLTLFRHTHTTGRKKRKERRKSHPWTNGEAI